MDEKTTQPDPGPHPNLTPSDKETTHPSKPSSETSTTTTTTTPHPNKDTFEPINPHPRASLGGRRSSSRHSTETIRRQRSNNGYGVDDIDIDLDIDAESAVAAGPNPSSPSSAVPDPDRDPFEVGWDGGGGGELDPLCPRSWATWRKWVVIAVTSVGSFCV
jgi:hypothetical protein